MRTSLAVAVIVFAASSAARCGRSSSHRATPATSATSFTTTTTRAAPVPAKPTYILEMQRLTGENPFARIVYGCNECSLRQFAAISVPAGWVKGNAMILVPHAQLEHAPNLPGVPTTQDFVREVPGNEFRLLARVHTGQLLGFTASGPVAVSQVERFTVFTYDAGTTLHELIDPQGRHYVLFAVAVALVDKGLDPTTPNAFAKFALLPGWKYASRRLEAPLTVDSHGLANVLTRNEQSLWQRYTP